MMGLEDQVVEEEEESNNSAPFIFLKKLIFIISRFLNTSYLETNIAT